ncbi:NAD(P)-binding protein [Polyplosphaeria fusca]|uniref:NAD(P)-binding protein n=1 Tax=Polyplosphaeria fusca TaxID=682080 RepID=A0A9P4V0V0_9PLEO|nr:NAD(P)-binding protein [Polyplosphaeria fusca]
MSLPSTYRSFRRSEPPYPLTLVPTTSPLPSPSSLAPTTLLVRVHAVSLNFRDSSMLAGTYPSVTKPSCIPCMDCAGEVVARGSAVKGFEIGDRVMPTCDLTHLGREGKVKNPLTAEGVVEKGVDERDLGFWALGAETNGVLAEYVMFEEEWMVKVPNGIDWVEAATLPCVGVTAWKCLNGLEEVREDSVALLQGTGGVSMFSLLLCIAAGITPIITSSSDQKLAKLKELGPQVQTINYKTKNVVEEVMRLTEGKGVDYVVNNIGAASVPDDVKVLRKRHGTIALVGFLGGFQAHQWQADVLLTLMLKAAKLQGVLAGSRKDFENLNKFLEEKKVRLDPILDRVFSFEESAAAFQYLDSGSHVGKVVIKM